MARSDAVVNASTVYGAYHALQTLSQLISFDFDTKRYSLHAAPWSITDAPRFSHREVLVDTARHWQPMPKLVISQSPLFCAFICPCLPRAARTHRQSHTRQTKRHTLAHCRLPVLSF